MSDREQRRRDVAANVGSLRAEGLHPDEATLADLAAYADGELSIEQGLARAYHRLGLTPPASR